MTDKDNSTKERDKPSNVYGKIGPNRPSLSANKLLCRHNVVQIRINSDRLKVYVEIQKLADRLKCRISDLGWYALEQMMKDPPLVTPACPAQTNLQSAPGYWTKLVRDHSGDLLRIVVVEVERRKDVAGHFFFQYGRGDSVSRALARDKAILAARLDYELVGINPELLEVIEFEDEPGGAGPGVQ